MTITPDQAELHLTQHKDDPDHAALLSRFWAVTITCEWCREPFQHTMKAAPKPKYCPEHRNANRRAYSKKG